MNRITFFFCSIIFGSLFSTNLYGQIRLYETFKSDKYELLPVYDADFNRNSLHPVILRDYKGMKMIKADSFSVTKEPFDLNLHISPPDAYVLLWLPNNTWQNRDMPGKLPGYYRVYNVNFKMPEGDNSIVLNVLLSPSYSLNFYIYRSEDSVKVKMVADSGTGDEVRKKVISLEKNTLENLVDIYNIRFLINNVNNWQLYSVKTLLGEGSNDDAVRFTGGLSNRIYFSGDVKIKNIEYMDMLPKEIFKANGVGLSRSQINQVSSAVSDYFLSLPEDVKTEYCNFMKTRLFGPTDKPFSWEISKFSNPLVTYINYNYQQKMVQVESKLLVKNDMMILPILFNVYFDSDNGIKMIQIYKDNGIDFWHISGKELSQFLPDARYWNNKIYL